MLESSICFPRPWPQTPQWVSPENIGVDREYGPRAIYNDQGNVARQDSLKHWEEFERNTQPLPEVKPVRCVKNWIIKINNVFIQTFIKIILFLLKDKNNPSIILYNRYHIRNFLANFSKNQKRL